MGPHSHQTKVIMTESFDVITIGRCGVDFYPTEHGSLVDVKHFDKFLGGSPTNVAVAATRLGQRSALISRTGPDPFGAYVHSALRGFGVDDRYVTDVEGFQTPVTFCETFPPDHFPIYFYREPKAPDLEIFPEELDYDAIKEARLFWATLGGLSREPSRSATLAALESRERRHPTILDLDYRPSFWTSRNAARASALEALQFVTIAVGNLSEVEVAVEVDGPDLAAERLLELGCEIAVVKLGPDGVLAKTKSRTDRSRRDSDRGRQWLGGRRRVWRRVVPRGAFWLEFGRNDSLRQRRRRDRGVETLVFRSHANG